MAVGLSLLVACKHKQDESSQWLLADFLDKNSNSYKVIGTPQVIDSPYGKSVYFDGVDDAIFLEENPLKTYKEFTVEMIFNPAVDGDFEQRIVHMGEVSGDRMLLEIRAKDGQWYFDGFAASNDNKKALIDSTLTHPLGKWHHVAFVVKPNSLATYVNGKKELFEPYNFKPIQTGKTSFGVRLNKRSWFKGSIYKIKVTPKELAPTSFMDIGP
ncbi:LamG domain-containing protein [Flavobacteriaceae bacterium GSB9]|nr:LamG domain-containing protein [Flavobacteriaceae bacterium GSB9]